MPTKQMKIYVNFPNFDQQSEEIKSLINFFMENASVFFHGNYDASNKLTSYTGELRFNNRLLEDSYADFAPYDLIIPYQNYFTGDFPVFSTAPQSDLSEETDLPYVGQDPIPVADGITNFTVASLTTVKTAMNFYSGDYGGDGSLTPYYPTSQFIETNTISIPVEIIPKVNDVPNTNIKLKPRQIDQHHTNDDGLYLQNIPIEAIFDSNGDPIAEGFVYDFQFMTEVFGLENNKESGDEPIKSVFYKIGITRLDSSITLDSIISAIKTDEYMRLIIHLTTVDTHNQVGFILDSSGDPIYYSNENFIEQHLGTGNLKGFATRMIIPVKKYSDDSLVALMYLKLYNANGSVYTDVVDEDFKLYTSDETLISDDDRLTLTLTDENIPPEPDPSSHPDILYFTSNGSEETQNTSIQYYATPIPTYWNDGSLTTGGYSNNIVLGTPCLMDGTPVSLGNEELVLSEGSNGTIEVTVHGSESVTVGYVPFTRS